MFAVCVSGAVVIAAVVKLCVGGSMMMLAVADASAGWYDAIDDITTLLYTQ